MLGCSYVGGRLISARRVTSVRRGVSTLALILAFGLVVVCIALAVDVGLLVQRHQQLKTASEASSLAGALQLFDSLPVSSEDEAQVAKARRFAVTFAAENSFNEYQLALDPNAANHPRGDIVVGACDPLVLGSAFIPAQQNQHHEHGGFDNNAPLPLNAILVRTRHSQAGGRGPILFLGSFVGIPSHDVFTESLAAVERRIAGYRPVGCAPVPLLPLICITERWEPGDLRLDDDHEQQQSSEQGDQKLKELDKFSYDPVIRQVIEESDGVPEIEIVLKTKEKDSGDGNGGAGKSSRKFKLGQKVESEVVQFLNDDDDDDDEQSAGTQESASGGLIPQVLLGLTATDLAPVGGQVMVGSRLECLGRKENKHSVAEVDWKEFHAALEQIIGQPRLLLLGSTQSGKGQLAAVVADFAAGVVVHSCCDEASVTIRFQPVVLNSCTAIAEAQMKSNPWIGKIVLVR